MKRRILFCLSVVLLLGLSAACSGGPEAGGPGGAAPGTELAGEVLRIVGDEPDTVDPQCTSEHYNVALNVFDRLVEVRPLPGGTSEIRPSLAESWEISPDGREYTFHLHENVVFSNGSPLTSSDVGFTLTRLLTHPDACNRDLAEEILGAEALENGETDTLEGFRILSDRDFVITLKAPCAAFLACLSTPGASILDEESTTEAGDGFGTDPALTVGTGPFRLLEMNAGSGMLMEANAGCWSGPPRCRGLAVHYVGDTETRRLMFENGKLDILDLEDIGGEAEYFIHGDIYQDQLRHGPRVGITYLALNQSVEPLGDVRVRRALQLALDRKLLLDAVYSGRGTVENGILPRGLIGHNPDLPAIPFDPEAARALLREAGYGDGFDLEISVSGVPTENTMDLLKIIVSMWEEVGVRAAVVSLDEDDYMTRRKAGQLACYLSNWSADYNDPNNFLYTFFGSRENTDGRSLCYPDEAVMERVRQARSIVDEEQRIRAYQDLERRIIQEDAAWIPLFSREHYFVINKRVKGFQVPWNGWSNTCYRDVALASP